MIGAPVPPSVMTPETAAEAVHAWHDLMAGWQMTKLIGRRLLSTWTDQEAGAAAARWYARNGTTALAHAASPWADLDADIFADLRAIGAAQSQGDRDAAVAACERAGHPWAVPVPVTMEQPPPRWCPTCGRKLP